MLNGMPVIVRVDHPYGSNVKVNGNFGVITDTEEAEGKTYYTVKDIVGNEFTYLESELENATYGEMLTALQYLLERR